MFVPQLCLDSPPRRARAPLFLMGVALIVGCGDSPVAPAGPFDEAEYGNLTYQIKQVIVAESFPIQIGVTVGVRNQTAVIQSVTYPDGCVVLMRAYGESPAPVWDLGNSRACTQALVERDVQPGEEIDFVVDLVSAGTILGNDLPSGEYRLTAYLRPDGDVVELEMGRFDLGQP